MTAVTEVTPEEISIVSHKIQSTLQEIGKIIVGQSQVCERILMGLIGEGHILLEGLPGLAKTTMIKALSESTSLKFSRIQFTPDLLPSDVVGTQIFNPKSGEFHVKKGPIFSNLVLADEINRAPAKVQSALLEAMQEKQVTIGEQTFKLDRPFLVMATQNPIEQEGTYPLPEAQVDRFFMKVIVSYNSLEEELIILDRIVTGDTPKINSIMTKHDIETCQNLVKRIFIQDKVRRYIVEIVHATRHPEEYRLSDLKRYIAFGASPRASISLERASRIQALFQGKNFVSPQDIKDVALDVLRHRIILTFEAEAENLTTDHIIKKILDRIDVP